MTAKPQAQIKGMPVAKRLAGALFQMPAKNPTAGATALSPASTPPRCCSRGARGKAGKIEVYDAKTGKSRVVDQIPRTGD